MENSTSEEDSFLLHVGPYTLITRFPVSTRKIQIDFDDIPEFKLTVVNGHLVYHSTVSISSLLPIIKTSFPNITPTEYLTLTKCALSSPKALDVSSGIEVENNLLNVSVEGKDGGGTGLNGRIGSNEVVVRWTVKVKGGGRFAFASTLGEVVLSLLSETESSKMINEVFTVVAANTFSLRTRVQDLEKQVKETTSHLCTAQETLEKFTNEKRELEDTLYIKFCAVLNAKKRKIRMNQRYIKYLQDSLRDKDAIMAAQMNQRADEGMGTEEREEKIKEEEDIKPKRRLISPAKSTPTARRTKPTKVFTVDDDIRPSTSVNLSSLSQSPLQRQQAPLPFSLTPTKAVASSSSTSRQEKATSSGPTVKAEPLEDSRMGSSVMNKHNKIGAIVPMEVDKDQVKVKTEPISQREDSYAQVKKESDDEDEGEATDVD